VNPVAIRPADLADLRAPRPYPAVSILAPMRRHEPGNSEDPVVLRDLADEAARRVRGELGARDSEEIEQRLHEAVESVDWRNPADGVAVFIAPGESRVLELPFSVAPRIAVDQTFATRDLVRGLSRRPRYRLLALGEKPTRLFEGQGSTLVEHAAGGFPCFVEGAHDEPLASGGFPVHSSRADAQRRAFFRHVDRALGGATAQDPLPLLVAGAERDLAYFDEITTHAAQVIGRIAGNYEDARAVDLAQRAAPLLDRYTAAQRTATIAELVEAIGPGRALVGIKAAWNAARAGRARILLVEDDFVYPAREVDDTLEPAGDAARPGVIDDAVDELIDMVLDANGEVVVVESGELGIHGPVALLLRY
jgi:hypothetical protein